jgi:peptide/nickel transport system permease protein
MVFSIPGIGSLLINAVKSRDVPVVMGTIIFVAVVVGVINLLVDLLYMYIDPRIKLAD